MSNIIYQFSMIHQTMFRKFNTKTLLILLVILGGIAAYSKYSSKKNENTFRDEFVKIDTSAVTQILIYPKADKGKETKITKVAGGWELQNDNIKTMMITFYIYFNTFIFFR